MQQLRWMAALALPAAMLIGCHKGTPPKTSEDKIVPVAKLSADELIAAYEKNVIAADQKYKDKPIQIEGVVANFGQMPFAGNYIGIGAGAENEFALMCFLYKNEADEKEVKAVLDKAAKLKVGDHVTLIGKCEGKAGGLGNIYLRHCYFAD
jgi:tRNA_anti-like